MDEVAWLIIGIFAVILAYIVIIIYITRMPDGEPKQVDNSDEIIRLKAERDRLIHKKETLEKKLRIENSRPSTVERESVEKIRYAYRWLKPSSNVRQAIGMWAGRLGNVGIYLYKDLDSRGWFDVSLSDAADWPSGIRRVVGMRSYTKQKTAGDFKYVQYAQLDLYIRGQRNTDYDATIDCLMKCSIEIVRKEFYDGYRQTIRTEMVDRIPAEIERCDIPLSVIMLVPIWICEVRDKRKQLDTHHSVFDSLFFNPPDPWALLPRPITMMRNVLKAESFEECMGFHLAKMGEMEQMCSICNNPFVPYEDGGTFDLDEGMRCGSCAFVLENQRLDEIEEVASHPNPIS